MVSEEVAWHDARRAKVRNAHPEVKDLYGIDRRSQLAILGVVAAHFSVARLLVRASLGPWLGATLVVGPTLAHAIGVLIHETSHNLVAKGGNANKAWGLVLNLPLGAPAAVAFRTQHALHHRHLAEVDFETGRDTQAPTLEEDEWVRGSWARKLASFTAGRFYWGGRSAGQVPRDAWLLSNWVTSLGAISLVALTWGAAPTLYLLCSSLLAFGPHPFGARRLSEHLPVREGQPTNSYYGLLNILSFNVGYHVEHHDFPNVPWTRIKRVRELAPEEYESLFAFRSWTRLIVDYLFDSRYRVRHYVGLGEPLGDEVVRAGRSGAGARSPAGHRGAGDPSAESGAHGKRRSGFFVRRGTASLGRIA